jgi:hypothetical protein
MTLPNIDLEFENAAAVGDGRCIGLIHSSVRPYIVDGRRVLVRESCDWWSEPSLRQIGVGLRLRRQLIAADKPRLSIDGRHINPELLSQLKWRYIGEVRKWIIRLSARALAAVALRKERRVRLARLVPGLFPVRRRHSVARHTACARFWEWRPGRGIPSILRLDDQRGGSALEAELRHAGFHVVRPEPVYWWGSDGPPLGAPLELSHLHADDGIPFGGVQDGRASARRSGETQ